MRDRIPFKGGDEEDALTKARRHYNWRPGELKRLKRKHNKRIRKTWKQEPNA